MYTPLLCATNGWVGSWDYKLQVVSSSLHPFLSLSFPFPITSWTAVMMVSVLRLTLTRVAWLYQTLVGAFLQIVICLQSLENFLAPNFTICCTHTLSPIQMVYTSHSLPLVLYLWQESAKSNLAFSFDFTSYQQPNITQVGFLSKGQWPLHAGLLRQMSMLVQYRVHGLDQSVIFRLVSYTLHTHIGKYVS